MKIRFCSFIIILCLIVVNGACQKRDTLSVYRVYLDPNSFVEKSKASQEGSQRQANWCWAACMSMVLNYNNIDVTQENMVFKVFGNLPDKAANYDQIKLGLNNFNVDIGYNSYEPNQIRQDAENGIEKEIGYNLPIIVGLLKPGMAIGHALY